jgi:C4-dicarboxylate-specific signal transduction histidine kinase
LTDFLGVDLTDIAVSGASRLAPVVENFVHPDEAAELLAAVRRSVATGEGYSMKYRLRGPEGVYRWVDTRAEPVRHRDGTIAQWYVVSLDVEDQMRAEDALLEQQRELRMAQERLTRASQAASLAELSASIAHEVNQPLAAVVANAHACQRWLASDPPNLERAQTTVERIIRDANAAADVVGRIRALFKQNVSARSGSSLASVITDAKRWVSDLALRHGVMLEVRIEPGVPPVAIDQVQMQQVVINLMRNAVEAMAGSPGARTLSVRASADGNVARIEVRDTGRGLEDANKVFDPFFTTKENGMGMGLAISRSIVESHGGRLWAEQNDDGGATFVFTLPVDSPART